MWSGENASNIHMSDTRGKEIVHLSYGEYFVADFVHLSFAEYLVARVSYVEREFIHLLFAEYFALNGIA